MRIQWLGTAGFRIEFGGTIFLVDPYLTRNKEAFPCQDLTPEDFAGVSHIFISHGHFDHIKDVPGIARVTGAIVYCCPVVAKTLVSMGIDPGQIQMIEKDGQKIGLEKIQARAFYSGHVRFDLKLLTTTLVKIHLRLPGIVPLFTGFPRGRVLSWQFRVGGRVIHFFGSAGSSIRELKMLGQKPIDILLLPLQGHSRICEIAVRYVELLSPKLVIPHHWDDFFPPVSKTVDISPFVEWVEHSCPMTRVQVLDLNQALSLE